MPKDYLDPGDPLTEEDWALYEELVREEEQELRRMARQQGCGWCRPASIG